MTRRNVLKSLLEEQLAPANSTAQSESHPRDRVLAGPVRTMSLNYETRFKRSRELFRRRSRPEPRSSSWTRIASTPL